MLTKEEFKTMLRAFGPPLDQCEVKQLSESIVTNPFAVKVCLAITIHGEPKWVEAEVDLRSIDGAEGVVGFAGKLLQAFEQESQRTLQ